MSLYFVDNASIDGPTRQRIRSHVMRGKNTGRLAYRSRIQGTRTPSTPSENQDARTEASEKEDDNDSVHLSFADPVANALSSSRLSTNSRRVLHQFLASALHSNAPHPWANPFRFETVLWLQDLAETDQRLPTHFCMMSACNDFFVQNTTPSIPSLEYFGRAVRAVNDNLSDKQKVSDATISDITYLVTYEQLQNNSKSWMMHWNGLCQLVQQRGGLPRLRDQKHTFYSICRLDIEYAIGFGCPTRFPLADLLPETSGPSSSQGSLPSSWPSTAIGLQTQLKNLVLDVQAFANFLNSNSVDQIDRGTFQHYFVLNCYRLLQVPAWLSLAGRAWHIGLVAFMVTLMFQLNGRRHIHEELLSTKLRSLLLYKYKSCRDQGDPMLWLLFVARLSVFEETDEIWIVPNISAESETLGITDWPGMRNHFVGHPWVDIVHNTRAQALWERVEEYRREESQREELQNEMTRINIE